MNIFDLIAEQKSKQRYLTSKDEAYDHFVKQKSAIDWIAVTRWFKEIKGYWQNVLVACTERLRTVKREDIKSVQGEMNAAMHFLDFLDNIQASDITPEEQEEVL